VWCSNLTRVRHIDNVPRGEGLVLRRVEEHHVIGGVVEVAGDGPLGCAAGNE